MWPEAASRGHAPSRARRQRGLGQDEGEGALGRAAHLVKDPLQGLEPARVARAAELDRGADDERLGRHREADVHVAATRGRAQEARHCARLWRVDEHEAARSPTEVPRDEGDSVRETSAPSEPPLRSKGESAR